MANDKIKTKTPTTNNFVAKHSQGKTGAGAHEDKKGKNASRTRQKRDWKKQGMFEQGGIFKAVNQNVSTIDKQNLISENTDTLSNDEIDRLVDYVVDEIAKGEKDGGVTDPQELASMSLENVPGMETADEKTIYAAVKKIEAGVAKRIRSTKK